ncbi:homeobox protein TGIF2LX-like isoform X2 [Hyla sarda]|nr:homeobox protein TGIF2LX-like isoform X2 [Hyla sarda]
MKRKMEAIHYPDAGEDDKSEKKKVPKKKCRQKKGVQKKCGQKKCPQKFPEKSIKIMQDWLYEHRFKPYPSKAERNVLSRQTRLTVHQVSNWFVNARRRILREMVNQNGTNPDKCPISGDKTLEPPALVQRTPMKKPNVKPLSLSTITSPRSVSPPRFVEGEQLSRLQILALVATQRIIEMEAEEARYEAATSALSYLHIHSLSTGHIEVEKL